MPNRIIRESICTSDSVDKLSWFEEVLFYRLIVNCDDFGRFDGRAAVVKNRLFPLKDNLTLKTVETALHGLANAGLITLYVFEGKRFLCLPTWGKYQTQRAKVSKYPAPENSLQADENICKQMISNVPVFENRESNSIFAIRDAEGSADRPPPERRNGLSRFRGAMPRMGGLVSCCRRDTAASGDAWLAGRESGEAQDAPWN